MTPKTKAESLVNAFAGAHSGKMSDYSNIEWPTAKKCAEICINQILKEYEMQVKRRGVNNIVIDQNVGYWNEVKQELENL